MFKTPAPVVSILVPSYRAGRYLGMLIDSVLAQTFQDWELLILDDGSGDLDHPSLVGKLSDSRIRSFAWTPNRGVSSATQFLMLEATGKCWCYPGADDLLMPTFIERRLELLADYPEVTLVFGKGHQIDGEGKETWFDLGRHLNNQLECVDGRTIEAEEMLRLLLAGNIVNTPSVFARCAASLPILTRYAMDWRYCQDWFYWLLLAANGRNFYYSGELLHSYRFHDQAMTRSSATWAWRNVEPALVMLVSLALCSRDTMLGRQYFLKHRLELFANWLIRSARFRQHPCWPSWQVMAGLANITWADWLRLPWTLAAVFVARRKARRDGIVMHGLPSVFHASLLNQEPGL